MGKITQTRPEKLFTASERRDQQVLKDKEKAEQARADHMAHLRELRLARDAAIAEEAATGTTAPKPAPKRRAPS